MRARLITALLAATMTVSACGRVPGTPATPGAPGSMRVAGLVGPSADATAHADRFAKLVRQAFKGQITQAKAAVTLTAAGQAPVRYDFAETPKTGMVVVATEGYETRVPEAKLLQATGEKAIPAIVVTIAVQMALGGAKALFVYYITHLKDFDQKEAIRATLIGMGKALVQFVPHGALLEGLVPIVVDMIMSIKVKDLKHICEAAMNQVDRIVAWVKEHVAPQLGGNALMVDLAK